MPKLIPVFLTAATIAFTSCHINTDNQDTAEATIASETGAPMALPEDAISVTKPLISGELYSHPDFSSPALVNFDTSQHIYLLDTTDALFMKARVTKNAESYTGFISKAILPE